MPKIPKYTKNQLDNALNAINKGIPIREAAKKFCIPRATLQFKLKNPNSKHEFGPNPYLSTEEEKYLEDWICEMGRRGFPRSAEDILDSVQKFLTENPRETPFVDNRPGKGWLKSFLKRHPKITQRTGEAVTHASACVTEQDIRKWFSEVADLLKVSGLEDILKDPSRIFNADESGFQTCPTSGRVFAEKGEKNVYIVDKGKAKENMTVLFAVSADGKNVLPTIVYPYLRLPERIKQSVPDDWGTAISSSGWMTADTFKYIIEHVFHPFLKKKNITLPVLLFVDGHKSHLTYDLSVLARTLEIEIFALYPNATRILQPADVSLFRPVKQFWKSAVREWMLENDGEVVTKQNFATVLKKVTEKINPRCIINGFRVCGLYPFNPDAVDYSKCIAKGLSLMENSVNETLSTPETSMPFSKFKEIVGKETINQFKQIKQIIPDMQNNEHFFILYQLWDYYKQNKLKEQIEYEPEATRQDEESTFDERGLEVNDIEKATEEPLSLNQEQVIVLDLNHNQPLQEKVTAIEETALSENGTQENSCLNDVKNTETQETTIITTVEIHTQPANTIKEKTINTKTYSTVKDMEQNFDSIEIEKETLDSEKTSLTDLITLEDLGVQEDIGSDKLPKSKTNLKDFLLIPTEPTRKGKRNVLRLPYHISGPDYQRMLEEKAKEKKNLEIEKRERRLQREQKRLDKKRKAEETKAAKIKKSKNSSSSSKQVCNICEKPIKKILLVCSECHRSFHKSCVPKSHQHHIPDEEGDNYLCHICYNLTDSTDNDENDQDIGNESGTDDEFLSNLQERQKELGLTIVKFN